MGFQTWWGKQTDVHGDKETEEVAHAAWDAAVDAERARISKIVEQAGGPIYMEEIRTILAGGTILRE